jgi:chemotaxis response regulator CheB
VEALLKPSNPQENREFGERIRDAVRIAVGVHPRRRRNSIDPAGGPAHSVGVLHTAPDIGQIPRDSRPSSRRLHVARPLPEHSAVETRGTNGHTRPVSLIAIGASTGGTEAIRRVLVPLPKDMPPIVIVQHMPPGFTASFAGWLDGCCSLSVSEATDGQRVERGQAVVGRGGEHLRVRLQGGQFFACLGTDPPVNRHRPSVDALFDSVLEEVVARTVAILLTGMGDDGASGLVRLRQRGALTIAESRESAVVFGMPKEAIDRGGACHVLPVDDIPSFLMTIRRETSV